MDSPTVSELGEREAIARIIRHYGQADREEIGPGDDCAVLRVDSRVAVTTDTMIEGTDFHLEWQTGFELGWKLAATNLSDVAAMGAHAVGLTVAIACPASTPIAVLEDIAEGLSAACRGIAPGCDVVGGDLSTSPTLMIAITALGAFGNTKPVTRSGARPGDTVAYAGELGLAAVGLHVLNSRARNVDGSPDGSAVPALWAEQSIPLSAQLAPTPPVGLGVMAARAGATSMIDVSDSLSLDASRVAHSSNVSIRLEERALRTRFADQLGTAVPLDAMLYGGEDHGLLATFPAECDVPTGFRTVGYVLPRGDVPVMLDGAPINARGWDPFLLEGSNV